MNPTPIIEPLEGEHLLATWPTLAPNVAAGWRRRLHFWTGRALTADALDSEQQHRSGHLAARGALVTPGIIRGLGVSISRGGVNVDAATLTGAATLSAEDLRNPAALAAKLAQPQDAVSEFVHLSLASSTRDLLDDRSGTSGVSPALVQALIADLNGLIRGATIWDETRFASVDVRPEVRALQAQATSTTDFSRLNRLLLEDAFPTELSRMALAGAILHLEPGLGLSAWGEPVFVPRSLEVDLNGVPWLFLDSNGQERPFQVDDPEVEYVPSEQIRTAIEAPWAAVLMLQPAQVTVIERRGPDDPCELDPDADAFSDPRRVECVRLRLCVLPAAYLPEPTSGGVAEYDASWRNRLAYHLFRREAARARRLGGGEFRFGDAASPWERLGVALGLLSLEPNPTDPTRLRLFLDRSAVVRPAGRPRPRPRPQLTLAAGAPPLWQARVGQFGEHLADLPVRETPDAASIAQSFRFLPPAGLLPRSALSLLTTEQARIFAPPTPQAPSDRAGTSHFFPAHWAIEAAPIPRDELDAAMAASAPLAAFDLASAEVDRVRLLAPVSRREFEPDLLVVAEPDARVQAELNRLIEVRQDWLWRRGKVRGRYGGLARLVSGKGPAYRDLKDDPERTDDDELRAPAVGFVQRPIYRTPPETREVATFALKLSGLDDRVPEIAQNRAPFLSIYVDREHPPQAIRVTFENTTDQRRTALVWSEEGQDPRWGASVAQEIRIGSVPAPGLWPQTAVSLAGTGIAPQPFHRVVFEVLRGKVAVGAGSTFFIFDGTAFSTFEVEAEPGDWALVPEPDPAVGPLEDVYEPVFADGSALIDRWTEVDAALRADTPAQKDKPPQLVPLVAPAAGTDPLTNLVGLEQAIQLLDQVADQADDFIDVNFTKAQTNLYRIRKFVLGENVAQKLLINPAIATIAEQETATATSEQLTTFVKAAKQQTVSREEFTKFLGGNTGGGGVGRATADRMTIAAARSPALNLLVRDATAPAPAPAIDRTREIRLPEDTKAILREDASRNAIGVAAQLDRAKIDLALLSQRAEIVSELPEPGPTLPPRGLAISRRFDEPKALSNLGYARSALHQVLNQLPQLRLRLAGERIRGFQRRDPAAEALEEIQVSFVNLQGFKDDGSPLDADPVKNEQARLDWVQKVVTLPIAFGSDELDEATVTVAALDLTEVKTAILRSIERVVQQRRALLERANETLQILNVKAQEAARRLDILDTRIAEARHDVTVARALWQEEQERTERINDRRDAVIAGVSFFAFVRPRTADPTRRDTPSAPLDRADAPPPIPECLQRHDQPPDELSDYIGLFRHSPARWFSDVAPRLKELDTPEKLVRLVDSAKSNARRYAEASEPSEKTRKSKSAVFNVYDKRRRRIEQKRIITSQLGFYQANDFSWGQHQELASEHASLGDVIDARHGHAPLAKEAAAMIDQLREVATCLHAEFARVTPALRLAWTERLSQFDADADLRNLSVLPRWGELSRPSRRRFQEFVHWLFQRVDNSDADALDLINDLIRLVLLLASHAPVNQLIDGHIPRPTPVFLDALVLVKPFEPGLVRAGMDVVIWDQAKVVARAKVEDLRGGDTAIRIQQLGDKVKSVEPKMRVQFVKNAAKTTRAMK